ncbi:MAG: hypothetical protein ACRDRL_14340 [Sciscionella sp.]
MTPALAENRPSRTELIWAPAVGSAWSEQPGWTLYIDGTRVANTAEDLSAEAAQRWANTRLNEGMSWQSGHGRWYFVAVPRRGRD